MKHVISILLVVIVAALGFVLYNSKGENNTSAETVENTTFTIENREIPLENGQSEVVDGPTTILTRMFGEPTYGDLDGDGDNDALVLLTQETGGSGTFYYVAAAINNDGTYEGTNALLLGDRIAPQNTQIQEDGTGIANYATREDGEPMTAQPSVGVSMYVKLVNGKLVEQEEQGGDNTATTLNGYLVMGSEVRTFRPCGEGQYEHWVLGDSSAYQELQQTYQNETSDVQPSAYAPLFVTIKGATTSAPIDGFGADYEYGVRVDELVSSSRQSLCKDDLIVIDTPLPGQTISSPVEVTGEARGYWFFEASFPITIVDWDGKILGEGYATADGEWMTEDFVPFTGTIEFDAEDIQGQYSNRGTIIFRKDNPSGLPENDDAHEVPVYFE